ncbi:acylneuraminate cytidylyltransferase family protein [Stutzerimonas nitrititolerans]|uniref:acylneuraminate cytidylyltransferase family protein n=1 Tax=Stutzerimonas nitrititolerans TaxID=2482751 RepID=UPI0028A9A877|nr:acylneuraminate cytidylyltransferase family protein [Stutzerimonas nitrititolerans]
MINKKKVLALITARAGSKGISRKNINPLAGRPLIAWTIAAARQSLYVDRLIVSSDGADIIRIAVEHGCEAPFVRPASLAREESSSMDVIEHAIASLDEHFDYLLLLQPTSPFRTAGDIDCFLNYCIENDADIAVSVSKLKKHPMYMYRIENDRLVPFLDNGNVQLRRQDMPPAYEHNGALYFAKIDHLLRERSFNTSEAMAYITEGIINLDIDTPEDWERAELIARKMSDFL